MQRRVARIMPAILRPSHAPFANAWREFVGLSSSLVSSLGMVKLCIVSLSSVSG